MRETAYAKLNLALHVRQRREDGYHELETLFAFCEHGDVLSASSASRDELRTVGEFAGGVGDPGDNLVARALNALPHSGGLAITLEKNLPVAAGLGGGSADAGAVFRVVERMHALPGDWQERALKLGADVPACVRSEMAVGRGMGEKLAPLDNDLSGTPVLLVNPRVALSTGPVFKAWDGEDRGALPEGAAREIALGGRNDLEAPAIAICPVIATVLDALRETAPILARMSGSGATCFALYRDANARDGAAETIAKTHPDWWRMATALR
ncbi:4-(cytidine 5'-diphospho)-2-C-methyl-D-erythritol kinase [Citromicrobium bathyomarinum]|uniref:4-(cytidine 5'-diphospho)-2-C-methyl-D-erythritol kinase n=1 Tax=Citromicrobium bathyomarinum TaxID=72174 RepID=UPI001E4D979C|nr:4-(cytidine 5'-diphospho)-2-C-methyl-D-erythritol kinase [Citromicrobium bathyomarinum]MCD1621354.1 4-(cytidine 5'-diphospho)-2-C-methyl-D-erythritol kinase [Citromicrobium bathyomarinum]